MQERNSLLSRDIQLACLDVIRYTTDAGENFYKFANKLAMKFLIEGMNCLIDDIRKATQAILSR
jgi:hypothetical protein